MLPVHGDTIYIAVHAKYADRLAAIAASIPQKEFRLLFMVFADKLTMLHLCDETSIDHLHEAISTFTNRHSAGNWLDPVIGVVLADGAVRPRLLIFSDGDVVTNWYPGTLVQMLDIVWLHEATTDPVITPYGERQEVTLEQ